MTADNKDFWPTFLAEHAKWMEKSFPGQLKHRPVLALIRDLIGTQRTFYTEILREPPATKKQWQEELQHAFGRAYLSLASVCHVWGWDIRKLREDARADSTLKAHADWTDICGKLAHELLIIEHRTQTVATRLDKPADEVTISARGLRVAVMAAARVIDDMCERYEIVPEAALKSVWNVWNPPWSIE